MKKTNPATPTITIVERTKFKYDFWEGINPVTNEMEYNDGTPSLEQQHWNLFRYLKGDTYWDGRCGRSTPYFDVQVLYNLDYWPQNLDGLNYRVLWTDGDDYLSEVFVATETEALDIYEFLGACKSYKEAQEALVLFNFEVF